MIAPAPYAKQITVTISKCEESYNRNQFVMLHNGQCTHVHELGISSHGYSFIEKQSDDMKLVLLSALSRSISNLLLVNFFKLHNYIYLLYRMKSIML